MGYTVSTDYLNKARFALRRSSGDSGVDGEITDLINQCRADLVRMGVPESVATDETNELVLGCVRCFLRWQFGIDGIDADRNHSEYQELADNLRKSPKDEVSA
jgi:hypothetical protein